MIVFRLRHVYDKADYDLPEPITLGYFSDPSKINEAVEFYRTLPGFRDYPKGFIAEECEIDCCNSENVTTVYEAYFCFFDDEEIYQYSNEIGIFTSENEAKEAISNFKKYNEKSIMESVLKKEIDYFSYEINQKYATDAFA